MRRATLLVLATIVGMLLATGVAVAVTKTCSTNPCRGTDSDDILTGTNAANEIRALKGNDVIVARAGNDRLYGDDGADALYGQGDNDIIYGGSGNDNFKTQFDVDPNGPDIKPNPPFGAGLHGGVGDDTLYGQEGDDDVIGNDGIDTLDDSSPENKNDWDRAFGGEGKDTINVADGDTRDEVSCDEDAVSTTHIENDSRDKVTIDVVYKKTADGKPVYNSYGRPLIAYADTVNEYAADGRSVECEEIWDKDGKQVFRDQLPPLESAVAAVEPSQQ